MNYEKKSFSVTLGGEKYADGWERTFGKKQPEREPGCACPPGERKFGCPVHGARQVKLNVEVVEDAPTWRRCTGCGEVWDLETKHCSCTRPKTELKP